MNGHDWLSLDITITINQISSCLVELWAENKIPILVVVIEGMDLNEAHILWTDPNSTLNLRD